MITFGLIITPSPGACLPKIAIMTGITHFSFWRLHLCYVELDNIMKSLVPTKEKIGDALKYLVITIATFLLPQSVVVVMHELTHSTVAWLLGYKDNPLGIIWGNPITMTGWDEGVSYYKYFSQIHSPYESVIGFSPIVVHSLIITAGLILMQTGWLLKRKWIFHFVYWFVISFSASKEILHSSAPTLHYNI